MNMRDEKRQMPHNNPEQLDVYCQTDDTVTFTDNKTTIIAESKFVFNLSDVR